MVSTGGQEMVVRILPQVSRLLQGSSSKQSGYEFDANDELAVSKEVRVEAYKLMIEMAAFAPVEFPLPMLVADVTDASIDLDLMNQALLAVFRLPCQNFAS